FFFFSYEGQRLRQPVFAVVAVPSLAARQAAVPATQPILAAFPIPNGPELGSGQAQLAVGYSNPLTGNSTSIRIDHSFRSKWNLFGRYSDAPSQSVSRSLTGSLSQRQQNEYGSHSLTMGLTYLVSPRTLNDLHLNLTDAPVTTRYILD